MGLIQLNQQMGKEQEKFSAQAQPGSALDCIILVVFEKFGAGLGWNIVWHNNLH